MCFYCAASLADHIVVHKNALAQFLVHLVALEMCGGLARDNLESAHDRTTSKTILSAI